MPLVTGHGAYDSPVCTGFALESTLSPDAPTAVPLIPKDALDRTMSPTVVPRAGDALPVQSLHNGPHTVPAGEPFVNLHDRPGVSGLNFHTLAEQHRMPVCIGLARGIGHGNRAIPERV